jgi:tetratricopeptide (TPR) repeat protein
MRLRDTQLLPLTTLISVDRTSPLYNEGQRRTIFYAQSWALTHMLLSGTPDRRPKLGDFLQYVGEGVPAAEAWQRAFAGDNVEKALDEYIHQFAFRYSTISFPEKIVAFEATATPLAEDDVQAFLADFLIRERRFDEAAERLKKVDPHAPLGRAVQARLAAEKSDCGGVETALRGLDKPDDWLVAYYAGAALADARESDGSMPDTRAAAARAMFGLVTRQRGEFAHVLAMQTELTTRSRTMPTAETRAAIERARELAPGRIDYAFLHANVLTRLGDYAAARRVLAPLMSAGYPDDVRNVARSNMNIVVAQEERENARKAAQAARARADETAAAVPNDAGMVTPLFRRVAPGEQRMQGVLERIECTPQGAATFNVRAPGGMVLLRAPRMNDVEFITYRDDLSGRFGCGALKTPLPVYVTWRPDAKTPAVRIAIAVEFLPKQQQ